MITWEDSRVIEFDQIGSWEIYSLNFVLASSGKMGVDNVVTVVSVN